MPKTKARKADVGHNQREQPREGGLSPFAPGGEDEGYRSARDPRRCIVELIKIVSNILPIRRVPKPVIIVGPGIP